MCLTPSFLSLSRAPCMNSTDTSSFSANHCSTNCTNHLHGETQASYPNPNISIKDQFKNHMIKHNASPPSLWENSTLALTTGSRGRRPWRSAAPWHTRCRATWPWSAGSCSRCSYTAAASRALQTHEHMRSRWDVSWAGENLKITQI